MSSKLNNQIIEHVFLRTVAGDYINTNNVFRIIPNTKNKTAICKDVYGNRIAEIPWPPKRMEE